MDGGFFMSEIVRWAILGASKFAREQMGPAIHLAAGNELAAIATRSPQKALPFQQMTPQIAVFDSYEAVLDDSSIDAVYVPLPNHLHLEWALKCLDAGKHVLVEKPVGMSVDEVDQLIAARDRTGLVAAEGFMIVHHPQWHQVRDIVRGGQMGDLRHVTAVFTYDNRADMQNIRNRAETGGGGLRDIGVYLIGGTRFVSGSEPIEVSGKLTFENSVDTRAVVTAQFPGFTFDGLVSTRMARRQEMVFHMDHGVVRLTAPFNPLMYGQAELHVEGPGFEVRTERFPGTNHYVLQVEAFAKAIRENSDYPCSLEFVRGTQAVLDQLLDQPRKG
jgi:predicted dehydrogenase